MQFKPPAPLSQLPSFRCITWQPGCLSRCTLFFHRDLLPPLRSCQFSGATTIQARLFSTARCAMTLGCLAALCCAGRCSQSNWVPGVGEQPAQHVDDCVHLCSVFHELVKKAVGQPSAGGNAQALDRMSTLRSSMQQEEELIRAMAHEVFEQARPLSDSSETAGSCTGAAACPNMLVV